MEKTIKKDITHIFRDKDRIFGIGGKYEAICPQCQNKITVDMKDEYYSKIKPDSRMLFICENCKENGEGIYNFMIDCEFKATIEIKYYPETIRPFTHCKGA